MPLVRKKCLPLILLLLAACASDKQATPSKRQAFENKHLFFDVSSEVNDHPCTIVGDIPPWLSGMLLRNGPAKFEAGGKRVNSWFDGLAMIHSFSFTPQKVLYSNRFIRSEQYYRMVVEGNLDFKGFAQDPCGKVFKNTSSHFVPKEMQNIKNAVVSIAEYANKMVALTEVPLPVMFDTQTIGTLGNFEYADKLPKTDIFESAHPQLDTLSYETINYLVRFAERSSYVIWKMKGDQPTRHIIAEIPVKMPSYMHSFAMTERYVILVEFPFVVDPLDLIVGNKTFIENYKWKPERKTKFLVVDRASGEVVGQVDSPAFFAFHHVNAYDENGTIVMDIVTYPNADVIKEVSENVSDIMPQPKPQLERFTLNLNDKKLSSSVLFEGPLEMPKVSARKTAQNYRYCYAMDPNSPSSINDSNPLYKIDVKAKEVKSWVCQGCYPGEPIFVPRPGGTSEDDGVVLSLILDLKNASSFLLILDATTWKELARATTPHAIPVGLHGLWKNQ
jgi:beta,beta-carotene 9',10'-dioxygenase